MSSEFGSEYGIHLTIDKPYGTNPCLNIFRDSVLRQYFGLDVSICDKSAKRFSYGTGGGISSVGIDPARFMTRPFTCELLILSRAIHELMLKNKSLLNLDSVDLTTPFNHCTILLYYASNDTKEKSILRPHTDCQYSHNTGLFLKSANSQLKNTATVVYSLGSSRNLKWSRRQMTKGAKGNKWQDDKNWSTTYQLSSDSISIGHPDDEDPMSPLNRDNLYQYLHGGVNITDDKFSVGFAFRVVDSIKEYDPNTNLMISDCKGSEFEQSYNNIEYNSRQYHMRMLNLFHRHVV